MFKSLQKLSTNPTLRRFALPMLKRLSPGDIQIRHHYTQQPVLLDCFRHKGYWFYGRKREEQTMDFFNRVLAEGDTVIEVGGHIGYISMYFADLVGEAGKVVVFEPGSNNLPYIRSNVSPLPQVTLIEKAISNEEGTATFFEEGLTGQNNSLHGDYDVYQENCERAFATASYRQREVTTIRLDGFVIAEQLVPKLIKIDIEGAEFMALQGSQATLAKHRPVVMVEVTNQKQEVFELFNNLGYLLFDDKGRCLSTAGEQDFNVCALHPEQHNELLAKLGWRRRAAA